MKLFFSLLVTVLLSLPVLAQQSQRDFKDPIYQGLASFYSKSLHGTATSSGEVYLGDKLTAACNKFKMNTNVRITNLSNGKSVIVRINDRMPFRKRLRDRIIDLSYAAAKKLGLITVGIAMVKIEKLPGEARDSAATLF